MAGKRRTNRSKAGPAQRVSDDSPLTSSPFAALQGLSRAGGSSHGSDGSSDEDGGGKPGGPPGEDAARADAGLDYRVRRARKGGWRLSVARRGGGRFVTILEGVEGDAGALLREFKRILGVGGRVVADKVEFQGDCRERLIPLLDEMAAERGAVLPARSEARSPSRGE